MRGASAYWTLVFTAASLEHLEERNVEAADVTGAVYTEQIALRLHEDLQLLRSLAAKRGVGHTTLARAVLEEWLAHSRSKTERAGRTKTHRPVPSV